MVTPQAVPEKTFDASVSLPLGLGAGAGPGAEVADSQRSLTAFAIRLPGAIGSNLSEAAGVRADSARTSAVMYVSVPKRAISERRQSTRLTCTMYLIG